MSEKIQPALSAIEWEEAKAHARMFGEGSFRLAEAHVGDSPEACAYLIALNNAELPESDPRKITRGWVVALRAEAERGRRAESRGDDAGFSAIDPDTADHIANALESYLPPESP